MNEGRGSAPQRKRRGNHNETVMNSQRGCGPREQPRMHETGVSEGDEQEGAPQASQPIVKRYYNYAARYFKENPSEDCESARASCHEVRTVGAQKKRK